MALRNNKGGSLATGPLEHFVSVHPRSIQQRTLDGAMIFDAFFSTSQDRIARQTLFKTSDAPVVEGFPSNREEILAISDMFVLPTGKEDGRFAECLAVFSFLITGLKTRCTWLHAGFHFESLG